MNVAETIEMEILLCYLDMHFIFRRCIIEHVSGSIVIL